MVSPGGPLVPPLETSVRLTLVVHAVPPSRHVQFSIPAHGLHANVLPAVLVTEGAFALARGLLAVVEATPSDRRARVSCMAAHRAPLPGTSPVALAAAARVAPLAPAGDLGRARLRLARVRLAEEGPVVDQPWLVTQVVRRREAAMLRAVPLAAFMLAVLTVRVFTAVWYSGVAVSPGSLLRAQRRGHRWLRMNLRSLQYLNLSGLPSLTLFMQLNPSGLMSWHRRSNRHEHMSVIGPWTKELRVTYACRNTSNSGFSRSSVLDILSSR